MKALTKGIVFISLLMSTIWFVKSYQPDMTIVYPDKCAFQLDAAFSSRTQTELKQFIDEQYRSNKDPQGLLPLIEERFKVVKAITIDMNNPERLRFVVRAYQPLFLLNGQQLVCENGFIFDADQYASSIIQNLESVSYKLPQGKFDVARLARFVQSLTPAMLKNFSIDWLGKNNVWMRQKNGEKLTLLSGYQYPPTVDDVQQCEKIWGQRAKRRKQKQGTTLVCDLRFNQQIVVFSTSKGG